MLLFKLIKMYTLNTYGVLYVNHTSMKNNYMKINKKKSVKLSETSLIERNV